MQEEEQPKQLSQPEKQKEKSQNNSKIQYTNAANKLMKQEWRTEEDYKQEIVTLELQNEKYRNQLYDLGESVNKILQKTKLPQSSKPISTPNMESQLEIMRKQLQNVNQFIEIYQKQLNSLGSKKKQEQIHGISETEELVKKKRDQLKQLKKQVKEISHRNKALEYKLMQHSKKNNLKSYDQQAVQLKQLINENKNLKSKLKELEEMQDKKQDWLNKNIQSAKDLQIKIDNQGTLPKIKSKHSERMNTANSLPKLQNEKKIYTKWLDSNKSSGLSRLEKQLHELQKMNSNIQDKIKNTTQQIKDIEDHIARIREKVQSHSPQLINENVESNKQIKKKDYGCMVSRRGRKQRRDWVGKFQSLRFSDSRIVRQQTRVYRVLCNSVGYFQFSYYSLRDPKKKYHSKLPFDINNIVNNGKQSTFSVQHPDFIKNIKLKINLKAHKVVEMHLVSNLGLHGQFSLPQSLTNMTKINKSNNSAEEQVQVEYEMQIKFNQAITSFFGSYGIKTDDKKAITTVWLEGLGIQLIEDFVQQLI